jgi:membrane-bound ClpP family serine protease
MLKSTIDGKTNIINKERVKKGDQGITITRLAPMGRVLINDENVEAKSEQFIDQNVEIEVEKILDNKIIVKLKNK